MVRLIVVLLLVALAEGRRLQQLHGETDAVNVQIAGLAAHDVIAEVVANGGRDTATATRNSINYAKMANNVFARPSDFDLEGNGARRHLLQDNAAFQRSDRIQVANLAAEDAINKAVASAGKTTGVATKKAVNFAKLANRGGSMLTDFDTGARRHLLQDNAAFQRSDRIQVANLAAEDAINKAVASAGKTTGVATKKAVNFAKLANRGGSMLTDFDTGARRHLLQDNAAFQRSDRIQVANLAAEDAINKAVASAGKTTGVATKKAVNFAKLANRGGSMLTNFDTGARR